MFSASGPAHQPASLFRLGLVVVAVLTACSHEGPPPAPQAELSRSHLAQHIERLLDDPSSLPSAVTPVRPEGADGGALAAEPDAAVAVDVAETPTPVTVAAVVPTPSPTPPAIPEPIVPVAVHPKKVAADGSAQPTKLDAKARKAQAKQDRKAAAAERKKAAREQVAHKAQAKAEAKARAKAKRLAAKAAAKERKAQAKERGKGKTAADEARRTDPKATKAEARAAALAAKAEAKAAALAAKAEAKRQAKADAKAEAKAEAKSTKPEPAPATAATGEGEDATELYYRGKGKLDGGDLRGAIADLSASQRARSSTRTLTLLGRAYFDANDLGAATKVLKQAGSHDEAQLLLATLYQQTGKSPLARKVYEAFLKAHPEHPRAPWVRNLIQSL